MPATAAMPKRINNPVSATVVSMEITLSKADRH
jgi:hypothetical protein